VVPVAARATDDRTACNPADLRLPRFVGRHRELAALTRTLVEPAVVLVEGEAGIGKSRLVQEFLAAAPSGRRILIGVCPPFRESLTLGPIVDAVRRSRDSLAGLELNALAGALRPLFPEWAEHLPPAPEPLSDPTSVQHRLFRALAELVHRLGVTVLVVEDVHWADPATLEFLLFLVSREPSPVSVVVTYRPEDVAAESLLLRLSSRLPVTTPQTRVSLAPLDAAATGRLVSSMLGGAPVSTNFIKFMHRHTEGVPLAVEESLRLLRDREDLVRLDGEWARRGTGTPEVPPTVRDAVLERVQRLGNPALRVLRACAVLGEAEHATVVVQVAGLTDEEGLVGLSEAVNCGLLREDTDARVAFRHILSRLAVYEATPAVERHRLHVSAGQALEQRQRRPVLQLTRHFRAANDSERWAHYAEQAAELAVASNDRGTATRLLNEVLTVAYVPRATRLRLARTLALAAVLRREQVDDLHRRVVGTLRTILDSEPLTPTEDASLRSPLGRLLAGSGDLEGARIELERAVPHLDHDPAEAARAVAILGCAFIGSRPATVHLRWLQRAAEIDTSALTPAERLSLAVDRAGGLLQLGVESGWQIADQIPAHGGTADERRQITRGHLNVGTAAILWGYYGRARERLLAALELADADGYLRVRTKILIALAQLDWCTGAWEGLTARVEALADLDGVAPVAYHCAGRLGRLYAARGAVAKAEEFSRYALDAAQQAGAVDDALEPAAALGRLRLAEGNVDGALSVTDGPLQMVAAKGVWMWATDVAPVRVEALVAAGEHGSAAGLVAAYEQGLRGHHAPAARAALAACHAHLALGAGEYERAAELFAGVSEGWERLPRPYDGLLAREQQAICLLHTGATAPALELLSHAFRALSDLGARGDADRVAVVLRDHGVDTRRHWRRGRRGYGDQLSPREFEVVRLLVTGRTNREIAEALSRSPKTVAGQLSSAMRKLNVNSRTALAVAAVDTGIVPADTPPDSG
jgi:DNA-binding CsgD family transcriptional regulator/tetratricopeptide (TPR) repeat protein